MSMLSRISARLLPDLGLTIVRVIALRVFARFSLSPAHVSSTSLSSGAQTVLDPTESFHHSCKFQALGQANSEAHSLLCISTSDFNLEIAHGKKILDLRVTLFVLTSQLPAFS